MRIDEVRERIGLGEDSRTEFKEDRVQPDDLAAAIVAFANGAGGEIFVGVADNGNVVGVSSPDKTMARIDNIARQNIERPYAQINIEKHLLDNLVILVVHVPRGRERPYRTNRGIYYTRGAAGRRIATPQELLEIFQSAGALHPDEMPVENAGKDDIDLKYLFKVRQELTDLPVEQLERALMNMKALSEAGSPTMHGLLCFGKDPQAFRPYARVTAIRHKGVEVSEDFMDRVEIHGNLQQQIGSAQDFIRKHIGGLEPVGIRPIHRAPAEAVDQAIINAVAHRDYMIAAQVRLFIFDDRIEVTSPGMLLNNVTIDAMRQGCHVLRNSNIFTHLSHLRIATDAGRGVPDMINMMRARGLPEPDFLQLGMEFRVIFRISGAQR